jgi:hypothetical protein
MHTPHRDSAAELLLFHPGPVRSGADGPGGPRRDAERSG